uniref:Uncharacterized protein n=1 Tax=Saccharum officinarum TaxID=4547 RepID=A0A678TAH9_SACOF|nr:hypothetical protein SO145G11_000012 [Saccharum officinarum]
MVLKMSGPTPGLSEITGWAMPPTVPSQQPRHGPGIMLGQPSPAIHRAMPCSCQAKIAGFGRANGPWVIFVEY